MYFPPEPGGGAITALNRALILNKIGYSVIVLCGFPSYPNGKVNQEKYKGKFFYIEKIDDITLIRLRLLPLASKGYLKRFLLFVNFVFLTLLWMPKILRISSNTELVYALAPIMFSSLIGFLYSKITKSFFIYEVSAFWPEELVALNNRLYSVLMLFGKIFAKISYALPDMLVVISNSAAQYLNSSYQPSVQVYTMPIGVDPNRYPARTRDSSRRELIYRKILPSELEKKFIVLYAGVITKITKIENLIHAANILKNNDDDIAFLVIGEGEEKQRLEEFRSDNGIDNFHFLPFQDSNVVPYMISAADVCIVPLSSEAIYETTVPTKFFDYLACYKPQIGICTGELASIINSNGIGLTVKDGEIDKLVDSICTLKDTPSLISSMEKNAHNTLKLFSLDALALKLDGVLIKEIAQKK